MDKDYYVYVYLDPRKPGKYKYGKLKFDYEPFYVGKGHKGRYRQHIYSIRAKDENTHRTRKIKKILRLGLKPIIIFYKKNIFDKQAKKIEIKLIAKIGRMDRKKGTLTNHTDGGDGAVGYKHPPEMIKSLSEMRKGQPGWNKGLTAETDERVKKGRENTIRGMKAKGIFEGPGSNNFGKRGPLSPLYGVKRNKEFRDKISKVTKGALNGNSKLLDIKTPDGFKCVMIASEFVEQYGDKYNISAARLYHAASLNKSIKGWFIKYHKDDEIKIKKYYALINKYDNIELQTIDIDKEKVEKKYGSLVSAFPDDYKGIKKIYIKIKNT
jgi:hypothetical protein